jgi:hypothetical protein
MGRGYATVPPEHDLHGRAGFRIPAVAERRDDSGEPATHSATERSDVAERISVCDVFCPLPYYIFKNRKEQKMWVMGEPSPEPHTLCYAL